MENELIKINQKDLDKILVCIKSLMSLKPELNETLMEFYCYLLDMKEIDSIDSSESSESIKKPIGMSLDEMIWDLGMNLPSWDDDLPNGK
tara:strand:- start:61 stop:330 length:270 start_codon:yes stop_codon:yes gene_type:complete